MLLAKNFFEFHARVKKCHFGKNEKFQPIFQILHIKSAWFLLELAMAPVTTIGMRFLQVWGKSNRLNIAIRSGTVKKIKTCLQITTTKKH